MTPGEVSPQYGLMWWLDIDPHGHTTWVARGANGQLIAVVPEHQLVVVVGSLPTIDIGINDDLWLWITDVIVPALG